MPSWQRLIPPRTIKAMGLCQVTARHSLICPKLIEGPMGRIVPLGVENPTAIPNVFGLMGSWDTRLAYVIRLMQTTAAHCF
jgi:hypothetical protein